MGDHWAATSLGHEGGFVNTAMQNHFEAISEIQQLTLF